MMHLSLPNDISEEQMLDVVSVLERGLTDEQATALHTDTISLILDGDGKDRTRLAFCRAMARLVNSGLY